MGKTAKPLSILVVGDSLYKLPEVQALATKGHVLTNMAAATPDVLSAPFDLIIGPQCWRVEPGLGDLEAILEMVLKGARKEKYGRVTKK